VWLSDDAASDASLVGSKAANLANAARAELPVLPGFVITTAAAQRRAGLVMGGDTGRALASAWASLSEQGARALIVRSSSTSEDGSTSSMAGMFESIGAVADWKGFVRAVDRVLLSAHKGLAAGSAASPMAVLVQPELASTVGGIAFGVDPLTGRPDRILVVAAASGPQTLVSGEDPGVEYVLSPSGRALRKPSSAESLLSRSQIKSLAQLATRAARAFGAPQDIEWAFTPDGRLVMFQSRPVTAVAAVGTGSILGPGPVAETFPNALAPLEVDLWVEPMRIAIAEALRITGAASSRRITASPVVAVVGGRVAADLDLLGASQRKRTLWQRLDPRPPARRLGAAWRVGRLRAAVGPLARRLIATIDGHLSQVPDPCELTNEQLLNVLLRAQRALVSIHGYEVLAGMLDVDDETDGGGTVAGIALRALALGRGEGLDDAQLVARSPEVLALVAPSIDGTSALPTSARGVAVDTPTDLGQREALRLRIRWVHELSVRCARELGRRLVPAGHLTTPEQVALLTLDELKALMAGGDAPVDLDARTRTASAPLPAAFRLSEAGIVVPVENASGAGKGAGGGRGMGRVHHGHSPQHGDVLVVQSLDPGLAHLLPSLGGLVAETGNVLSHLAILAREFGIPTVVGMAGAREAFTDGVVVVVDGSTGEVFEVEES
jgi:pyruvate,water dikinase